MIPIIDLLIKRYIDEGLARLREDPERIRRYFKYASDKTINDMIKLVTDYKIGVKVGYPRDAIELPCFVITIAGENEIPYGIGDGIDENYDEFFQDRYNYLEWDKEGDSKFIRENAQIRAQVRVEVWSGDEITTAFLYAIGKYCLLSAKWDMINQRIVRPEISGGDLEPAPEYISVFVFRRALMLNFEYELAYHVERQLIGDEEGHLPIGTTMDDIKIRQEGYYIEGDNIDDE